MGKHSDSSELWGKTSPQQGGASGCLCEALCSSGADGGTKGISGMGGDGRGGGMGRGGRKIAPHTPHTPHTSPSPHPPCSPAPLPKFSRPGLEIWNPYSLT